MSLASPRVRRAFMLGKFMPPHLGHLLCCEAGRRLAERMTVLVCSTDAEPIDGCLRAAWMRDSAPGCQVLHMHRDIPQAPSEHPDFWSIWRRAVRELHPEPIDVVIGSEPYIAQLAEELCARPVLIDPDRELYPVSGTAVRASLRHNWRWLPPPVQRHYRRRVCLLGPESTGKSTLSAALAARFETSYMPEYGRTYDAVYRRGDGWTTADFVRLAELHACIREPLMERAGALFFEDTDALQTAVWSERLGAPMSVTELLPDFAPADLYLLLSPDVPWLDDGTRYFKAAETRAWFFDRTRELLETLGAPYEIIAGESWQGRARVAAERVSARLH